MVVLYVGKHPSKETSPLSIQLVFVSKGACHNGAAYTFQPLARCELFFTHVKFK